MQKEICNHGYAITDKLGIACPEGCLSNNQRGIENRQLSAWLQEATFKQHQLSTTHVMVPRVLLVTLKNALLCACGAENRELAVTKVELQVTGTTSVLVTIPECLDLLSRGLVD